MEEKGFNGLVGSVKGFGDAAGRLSRNPLGIIALFIVLVYAMSCLVFSFSISGLAPNERQPIVWFLVVFPVIVLVVFVELVEEHHTKLYAPEDFQDAEGFFRAMNAGEYREHLERGVLEVEKEEALLEVNAAVYQPNRDAVRSAYLLAEELALRELEQEFGVLIRRQVALGSQGQGFDGVFLQSGKINVVDVKLSRHHSLKYVASSAAADFLKLSAVPNRSLRFVLLIVSSGVKDEAWSDRVSRARSILAETGLSIELRVYKYENLREKYGLID